MRQTQTLAPQMRQSLRMLQMTSLELRAELQHQMETNPAIEDVTGKMERPMSSELPEEHVSGAVSTMLELNAVAVVEGDFAVVYQF